MVNVNDIYNKWEVIDIVSDTEALCRCTCEKHTEKIVSIYNLTSGRSKSCGCDRYDSRRKDLVGEHFGDWEVIKMLPARKCLCKCVCGVEKEQYHSNLTNAKTEYKCKHKGDVNKQFGNWVIVKELGGGKVICQCQCENKTTKELYKKAVISGETKSCGCMRNAYKDIVGKQFGEWTVLKCTDAQNEKYLCQCSCENKTTKEIYKVQLTHGRTRSCGCKKVEHLNETMMSLYGENNSKRIDNPREHWKIDTLHDKDKLVKYINNLGYKPTVQQLAFMLDVNDSTLLPIIHSYNMEDYIIINSMISEDELKLQNWVKSICTSAVYTNVKNVIQPYELDIYIPEKKIAIEFNGNYWHSTKQKDSNYHQQKTIACAKQGIQLIHVFEYEWKQYEDKIKKLIFSRINDINTVYARDTYIKEIDNVECKQFLEDNHIQGFINSSINIALIKNDSIVSLMTFGKPRFDSEYDYEILRFCNSNDIRVVGGAEKLFKYFINKYDVNTIVTYSDISKFTGNIYTKLGFSVDTITKPSYVWVNTNNNQCLSRYQTQKHRLIEKGLGDESETEDVIMDRLGYLKIYNSGNIKMSYNKKI